MSTVLLPTAYLPNLYYLGLVLQHDVTEIEYHEHFVRQTYRNRCDINTASGKSILTIPLVKQAEKEITAQKRISYAENWQQQHWRSITVAYKNSPYFEYFEDEFKSFYHTQYEFLVDFNNDLLQKILHILRITKQIVPSKEYKDIPTSAIDERLFHLKSPKLEPYYQVFSHKIGFVSHLSCLDALFNIGLNTTNIALNLTNC